MVARKKVPAKKVPTKKPAVKRTRAKKPDPATDDDDLDDILGDDDESRPLEPPPAPVRRITVGDRKLAELLAALRPDVPKLPYPFGLLDKYKPFWLDLVNSRPVDFFNDGDIPLLKLYVRLAADVARLDAEIEAEGEVIYNARNNPIVNPKVVVRSFHEQRILAITGKLMAAPSSRHQNDETQKGQAGKANRAKKAAKAMETQDGEPPLLASPAHHAPQYIPGSKLN